MSIALMSAVWQDGPNDRSERLLLLALADCANDQGLCWPHTQTLARKACMNVRTVLRTLKTLDLDGWLTITRRSHERRGNTYQLSLERLMSRDKMSRDTESRVSLSRDKPAPSEVTNSTKSHDKMNNPPHPPIGRTIKNRQEPSGEDLVLTGEPSVLGKAKDGLLPLVKAGWIYYLEKVKKSPTQYELTPDRVQMGVKGFEALVAFARRRDHPDPWSAAPELFRSAVDRLASDPFHNGDNDRHQKYLDWHHLFHGKGYPEPRKLLEFWLDDDKFLERQERWTA